MSQALSSQADFHESLAEQGFLFPPKQSQSCAPIRPLHIGNISISNCVKYFKEGANYLKRFDFSWASSPILPSSTFCIFSNGRESSRLAIISKNRTTTSSLQDMFRQTYRRPSSAVEVRYNLNILIYISLAIGSQLTTITICANFSK